MINIIDMDINYERFISFLQERIICLQTYIDSNGINQWILPNKEDWKKLYIFEISENIIFLNNNLVVPISQRSFDFKYIVYPELTLGCLAFTKGISSIIYNHFNNEPILIDIIIKIMIKFGISIEDIQKVGNNILLKNKKISGYSCETRMGYSSEIIFITMNYNEELISKGFNYSEDLNEYSGIKNIYPEFNESAFYSNIYHELSEEKSEYEPKIDDNIVSLLNVNEQTDINFKLQNTVISENIEMGNVVSLLEQRIVNEAGGIIENFKEFNDEICFEIYKKYRPILENYSEEIKECLYRNRFEENIILLNLGLEENIYNNMDKTDLKSFPINIAWRI